MMMMALRHVVSATSCRSSGSTSKQVLAGWELRHDDDDAGCGAAAVHVLQVQQCVHLLCARQP